MGRYLTSTCLDSPATSDTSAHLRTRLHTSVDTLHFAEVVATARPMHLTLSMSVGHLSPLDLPTYLCVPGLADVKNLEIHVTMCVDVTDGNDGDFDIGAFLVSPLFLNRLTPLIPGD